MSTQDVSRFQRAAHRDGVTAIALAALIAGFAPVAAKAGTETQTLRYVTAGVLAAAGVLVYAGGRRLPLAIAAVVLMACAWPAVGATWLVVFALLCAVDLGIARLRDSVSANRAAPPAVPDGAPDGESTTDIIESVATAFILALIVREFAFEAFKIPTGSMEPTIYGEGYGRRTGDRLLAAKSPLYFTEPARWQIMVFKYPLFRPTNFIKRLVGLPGERLQNKDGDIYVNGKCVAKPDEVQESLWLPMLPNESGEWPGGVGAAFTSDGAAQWKFAETGAVGTAQDGKTGWIIHQSGYGDVRVSFDVDASQLAPGGAVLVRLDGSGRRVELEAGRDAVWLTAPGVAKTQLDVEGLGSSVSRLGFAVADRVVRVYRDGRLVAKVETKDETNFDGRAEQAWIGVTGGTATFAAIEMEHDLQYSDAGPGDWQIPEGCYFMMGDNTRASRDSRLWTGKVFRTTDGREFVADDNIRLDDEHSTTNVHDVGDAFEFYDSYGVKRHIAKTDLVGGMWKTENQPFVKREDLVGRAFFIFWPIPKLWKFPPEGEWRPRLLP